jgi:hypothetical protein
MAHALRGEDPFPFFIIKIILVFIRVDKKKIHRNLPLGFFIKPHSSSPLNLLGKDKKGSSKRLLEGEAQRDEPG